jgi:hypothetical protein
VPGPKFGFHHNPDGSEFLALEAILILSESIVIRKELKGLESKNKVCVLDIAPVSTPKYIKILVDVIYFRDTT